MAHSEAATPSEPPFNRIKSMLRGPSLKRRAPFRERDLLNSSSIQPSSSHGSNRSSTAGEAVTKRMLLETLRTSHVSKQKVQAMQCLLPGSDGEQMARLATGIAGGDPESFEILYILLVHLNSCEAAHKRLAREQGDPVWSPVLSRQRPIELATPQADWI